MGLLTAFIVFLHLGVPLLLCAWLIAARMRSWFAWLLLVCIVGVQILEMHIAGAWSWFGFHWRWPIWGLFVVAIAVSWRYRCPPAPWPARRFKTWIGPGILLLLALFQASGLPSVLFARSYEGNSVRLRFPLAKGVFIVGQGGGNEVMSHHSPVRAQRYALDVARLNNAGRRAEELFPAELAHYAIWGTPVLAPCEGEIVFARNDLPDVDPGLNTPAPAPDETAGNYVALHCDGVTVLLAHLQRGTVAVQTGEHVRGGHRLGSAGNSGNTTEPHLHVHAVRGRVHGFEQLFWKAEGVPMLFDNRFLIRNDVIDAR